MDLAVVPTAFINAFMLSRLELVVSSFSRPCFMRLRAFSAFALHFSHTCSKSGSVGDRERVVAR